MPSTARTRSRWWIAAVAIAAVVVTVVVVLVVTSSNTIDPFAYSPAKQHEFERRAAAGESHLLYSKSPGGVNATAARVDALAAPIRQAATATGVDPRELEAIVFLESGGRPNVIAGNDPAAAAGVGQILAVTGRSLLGMHIDLAASRRLTSQIATAQAAGNSALVRRLERRRRAVDDRFDPSKALVATGRYLAYARAKFGREDLAVAAYHMGIGNLANVIRAYAGERRLAIDIVRAQRISYAQLYFDSTPLRHSASYRMLVGFGDDSDTYYWRVLAAEEIMRLYRQDRGELARLNELQTSYPSAEAVLHPPAGTPVFADQQALASALSRGALVSVPDRPSKLGFALDPAVAAQVRTSGRTPKLYMALRPQALAVLYYIGERVHAISGGTSALRVGATVRDAAYQRTLAARHAAGGAGGYSLYTTGYSFDIERRYASHRQAEAFQQVLDRLQALDAIAWNRASGVIHITASGSGGALRPLLDGASLGSGS